MNKEIAKNKYSYSVIIPVYNEEKNIEECVRRISRIKYNCEIVIVDDGSTDNTSKIVQLLKSEFPNINYNTFSRNYGKAKAVEVGIGCANGDVAIILDADMAVAPEDIPLFIEPLESDLLDFVNGSRLIYAMKKESMSQLRHSLNFLLAIFFSALIRYRVTDVLCGTKAFFRHDFKDITISGERWGDLVLIRHAKKMGLRIGEVPVSYHARKAGESKMRIINDGLRFIMYIFKTAVIDFWDNFS